MFILHTFYAQIKTNNLQKKKNAISLCALGISPLIGFSIERMLSDKLAIEVGIGQQKYGITSGIGIKYVTTDFQIQKLKAHIAPSIFFNDWDNLKDNYKGRYICGYLGVGANYIDKYGFNYSIDIGPIFSFEKLRTNGFSPYGSLKFGYRF